MVYTVQLSWCLPQGGTQRSWEEPLWPTLFQGILSLFFVGQLGYNTTRFPYCQYSFFKFFREILLILFDIYS